MEALTKLFLTFIIISFIGWCIEEFFALFIAKEKVNRGFLIGPLCPIYGFSSVIMILVLDSFKNNLIMLFFLSMIICAVFEYITSFVLEKLFKIKLWNYDKKEFKYSIHGRIALETLIPFGLLGIVAVRYANPIINGFLNLFNIEALYIIAIIVAIILLIDIILSIKIILTMKNTKGDITKKKSEKVKKHFNDATNEVKKQVKNTNENVKKTIKRTSDNVKSTIKKTSDNVKNKIKRN